MHGSLHACDVGGGYNHLLEEDAALVVEDKLHRREALRDNQLIAQHHLECERVVRFGFRRQVDEDLRAQRLLDQRGAIDDAAVRHPRRLQLEGRRRGISTNREGQTHLKGGLKAPVPRA